jgi:type I restriction enzyme S subunit
MENGKVAVVPESLVGGIGFGSTEFVVLRPRDGIEPRWLSRFLSQTSFRRRARRAMTGAVGQQRVPKDFIATESLRIAPYREQQRIADKIDELFSDLDAGVKALGRVKKNLERYRASVLKAAVEGRLTADWRKAHPNVESATELLKRILKERRKRWEEAQLARYQAKGRQPPKGWQAKYKEPAPPDTSELPSLPEGWCWATVDMLGVVSGGLTKNPSRDSAPRRMPYLRVANVYADRLALDDVKLIGVFDRELPGVLVESGDLLVVEGNGSKDQIGRVATWDGSVRPCAHQNHIIKVRFLLPELGRYVQDWLLSVPGRRRVEKAASSTSGLYTLSISKVQSLQVPLPPLQEILAIRDEVERNTSLLVSDATVAETTLRRTGALRQAILKRAFEGRLVPQDPNDEPAEKLLERIRAERRTASAR